MSPAASRVAARPKTPADPKQGTQARIDPGRAQPCRQRRPPEPEADQHRRQDGEQEGQFVPRQGRSARPGQVGRQEEERRLPERQRQGGDLPVPAPPLADEKAEQRHRQRRRQGQRHGERQEKGRLRGEGQGKGRRPGGDGAKAEDETAPLQQRHVRRQGQDYGRRRLDERHPAAPAAEVQAERQGERREDAEEKP